MTIKDAIDQLDDLRLDHGSRIEDDADCEVWEDDVEALAMAIGWGVEIETLTEALQMARDELHKLTEALDDVVWRESDLPGWIRVIDQLPDQDVSVLVYRPHMIRSDVGTVSIMKGWMYRNQWAEITHWMPLPEPPDRGEE